MKEERTAEERAYLADHSEGEVSKLLHLYDAALARAEAAEKGEKDAVQRAQWDLDWRIEAEQATKAAESALAEATALLERCRDVEALRVLKDYFEARYSEPTGCNQVPPELAFTPALSRTPAPSATFEHPGAEQVFRELQARRTPAPAAKAEPE